MTFPSKPPPPLRVWDDPRVRFPDEESWSRMSQAERDATVERILAVLDEHREAMSEGVRHFRGKSGIRDALDGHFRRAGRQVFVACELAVFYPAEPVVVPDVLAVLDCDPDIEPESWIVADRKRGIDLVIEVRNLGKKHKDLVENVRDYARLRIPEYFSFDCRRGELRGWRLARPDAQTYRPLVPQRGGFHSQILGLGLAVVEGRLRFIVSDAMVPESAELAARLQGALDETARRLDAVARERDAVARERDAALERLARTRTAIMEAIVDVCAARGVELTGLQHARVVAEDDPTALTRWLTRAATAADGDAVFDDA